MARDEKVVIRLTPEIKQEFQSMAEEYGMTISALGSYCIGKFIRQQKNEQQLQEKMIPTLTENMAKGLNIDDIQLSRVFEQMAKSMSKTEN